MQAFPEPGPMTPGPSDVTFEVPVVEASLGSREPAPTGQCVEDPPARWVRSCVELPGYARGRVPLSSPSHSTTLDTMMQVDRSLEDHVVQSIHVRAWAGAPHCDSGPGENTTIQSANDFSERYSSSGSMALMAYPDGCADLHGAFGAVTCNTSGAGPLRSVALP